MFNLQNYKHQYAGMALLNPVKSVIVDGKKIVKMHVVFHKGDILHPKNHHVD